MKTEELSVCTEVKATGKVQKPSKNISQAEQPKTELPGNEGSKAAELNNRQN
jgi:hypothetical protein